MEELVRQGLVRAIGVSNFSIHKLDTEILPNATIPPAVVQVSVLKIGAQKIYWFIYHI